MSDKNNKVTGIEISKQLWIELRIAFFCALSYVVLKVYSGDIRSDSYFKLLESFIAAFFLVGSFTGQWVRVKKQLTVEKNFNKAENKMIALTNTLETKTNELISHMTGGDSYFYYKIVETRSKEFFFSVIYKGNYTLSNITINVFNQNFDRELFTKDISNLNSNMLARGTFSLDILEQGEKANFYIQFLSNNRSWFQVFNYTVEGNKIKINTYVRVDKENKDHFKLEMQLNPLQEFKR
jgi:hypothetical protein